MISVRVLWKWCIVVLNVDLQNKAEGCHSQVENCQFQLSIMLTLRKLLSANTRDKYASWIGWSCSNLPVLARRSSNYSLFIWRILSLNVAQALKIIWVRWTCSCRDIVLSSCLLFRPIMRACQGRFREMTIIYRIIVLIHLENNFRTIQFEYNRGSNWCVTLVSTCMFWLWKRRRNRSFNSLLFP